MATAEIKVNGTAGSNDDIELGSTVVLSNNSAASTYQWALLSQPEGPTTVLSSTSAPSVSFNATKEGSYLVRLVVNAGLPDESIDQVIVAVRELETRNRIPAAGETTENDAETGWSNTAVDQILQRVTRLTDQGVLVGQAGESGLLPLDVVFIEDIVNIASGLPGERPVPLFAKALAVTATNVRGLLGVVLGGVNGSPAPANGSLIRVGVLTLVQSVPLVTAGQPAGTPVYVNDLGRLSLTPGTVIRQVGTTIDDMGAGSYGVWVTGEGSFGTIQDVTATAPVTVTAGVAPVVGLDYDTDTLAVIDDKLSQSVISPDPSGTYGEAAPTYPDFPASLVPSLTVDEYGRVTAASQAGLTIGGEPAKDYVDQGDADTLAAAELYAQTLSYGMSSKVPVHVSTTIALPACTVNGSFQTLTANVHGPLLPVNTDGHDLLVGERLLVKNQVAQANNGIYVLTQKGATSGPSSPWILTRADDANTAAELCGSLVTVNTGDTLAGSTWLFAYNPTAFTLGTTPVTWTQQNVIPAQPTVYGTVKLAGGLGGSGTLAEAPVLALNTGFVSGVLAAEHGGTGLPGSSNTGFLRGSGSGWVEVTEYSLGGVLEGAISSPEYLRGVNFMGDDDELVIRPAFPSSTTLSILTPTGRQLTIQPRVHGSEPQTTTGDVSVKGEDSGLAGVEAGFAGLYGGANAVGDAGNAIVSGGAGCSGGDVYVSGGAGTLTTAGQVFIRGGEGSGTSTGGGGDVTIHGGNVVGLSGDGGNVYIYPGLRGSDGESTAGFVYISKSPGASSGGVSIADSYINGTGTTGQVFTSNGTGSPPSWQDLGGESGPASSGAYRATTFATSLTLNDYCLTCFEPIVGASYTVFLPDATTVSAGRIFIVKSMNQAGNITVDSFGTDTIDGGGAVTLAFKGVVRVMRTTSSSSEWITI